jgi:CHAT domain-containing protein/tetratricopeptide (TPR) repeat protein
MHTDIALSPDPDPEPAMSRLNRFALVICVCLLSSSAIADDTADHAWAMADGGDPAAAALLLQNMDTSQPRLIHVQALHDFHTQQPATSELPLYLGCLALEQHDYAAADSLLRESLTAYEALDDTRGILVSLERLVAYLMDTNQTEEAMSMIERATALEPVDMTYASLQLNLGRAMVRGRDLESATAHFNNALPVFQDFKANRLLGTAWLSLSVVSRLQMDLDTTLARREQALAAYRAAGDQRGQARSLHYCATTHIMRGDVTRGATMLHEAIELARAAQADDVLGGCLGDLAGVNYLVGNFERARDQYREAGELARDPRRKAWYQLNTGSILAYEGRHEEALPLFDEARATMEAAGDHRNLNTALHSAGQSLCELGRYQEGLTQLDQAIAHAIEWDMPMNQAYALHYKGHALLDQNQLDEAAVVLAEAGELARQTGYFDIIEASYLGQAKVARNRGQMDEALGYMNEALTLIDDVRRRSGGSTSIQTGLVGQADRFYDEMIDLLFEMNLDDPDQGYDVQAFDVAQSARARSLLDMLAEADVDLHLRADETYQQRETAILTELAEAQDGGADPSRIGEIRSRLDVLENELRGADPRYADIRYPRPCDLAQAQARVLGDGELLLDFQLGREQSHLWAVSREGFRFVELPPREEIETKVRALLPMLRDYNMLGENPAWLRASSHALYRMLLQPVADEIQGASHLLIVPDGLLHYLPFEALVTRPGGGDFSDLSYLIMDWNISYAPGLSVMSTLRDGIAAEPSTANLLIGNPLQPTSDQASILSLVAGAADLQPVPFGRREIEAIAGQNARVLLTGAEATTAGLRAAGAGPWHVVHFATHGLFNEERPEFSGLVLSADEANNDDGFLSTGAVFGLDLSCDLAVLAACSSALGRHTDGEGLTGLTRAFIYAGAGGVVSSLWDVSGSGTARFMEGFYRQLGRSTRNDHARALSDAKRELILSGGRTDDGLLVAHPAIWAAFVLNGGKFRPGS